MLRVGAAERRVMLHQELVVAVIGRPPLLLGVDSNCGPTTWFTLLWAKVPLAMRTVALRPPVLELKLLTAT